MFDPFEQAKIMNGLTKLRSFNIPEQDTSVEELKRLSGVDKIQNEIALNNVNKAQFMKENNIKSGTEAWFKLWFARPDITGEDPFSKK
jgi:hypothetical protein